MQPIYQLCQCGSGSKFKFCCGRKTAEEILRESSKFPLVDCLVSKRDWHDIGIAMVFVARRVSDKLFTFGVYCVDTYCLGVKDTFAIGRAAEEDYSEARRSFIARFEPESIAYEDCRSLILGAVAYARQLGFEPHEDWRDSKLVIEAAREFEPKFEYGKDGKVFYVPGPNDDSGLIVSILEKSRENFAVAVRPT